MGGADCVYNFSVKLGHYQEDRFVADAHRGDGKRFVLHADEKLTALLELDSAVSSFR
jgi:hypothetical protein